MSSQKTFFAVATLLVLTAAGCSNPSDTVDLSAHPTDVLLMELGIRHALRPSAPTNSEMTRLAADIGIRLNPDLKPDRVSDFTLIKEVSGRIGRDDRTDVEDVHDRAVQENAKAVCAIVETNKIWFDVATRQWIVEHYETQGEKHSICEGNFIDQPTFAYCTGFLVGDSLIATAGHALTNLRFDVSNFVAVFGYATDSGRIVVAFDTTDVFLPVKIEESHFMGHRDWGLVRLDRSPGRAPVTIERANSVRLGDTVYMLGYGEGLPLKYTGGASVSDTSHKLSFQASLDAFGGDSGAPVFAKESNRVVGMAIRSEQCYVDTLTGERCIDTHDCCRAFRFGDEPECHTAVLRALEFADRVFFRESVSDSDTNLNLPKTLPSDTKGVEITVESRYAIMRVRCGPPHLLKRDISSKPLILSEPLESVSLLSCDGGVCEWRTFSVVPGGRYAVRDSSAIRLSASTTRWLSVKLEPYD
jgi:hypothetical protein